MDFFRKLSKKRDASPPPPYTPSPQQPQQYAPPSPPRNPDGRPLPPGWITQLDSNSGRWFYVYTPTAHRQWEHPVDRPLMQPQTQQSGYTDQPQPQYAYYQPQQQLGSQQRLGGAGSMLPMAAAGLGGGVLGYMLGDAITDHAEERYYDQPDDSYYIDDGGGGFDDYGGTDYF